MRQVCDETSDVVTNNIFCTIRRALLLALLFGSATAQASDEANLSPDSPLSILNAMLELESESDAKCASTANRFENFVYGTPLSEPGRRAKQSLQKDLVARVWGNASRTAKAKEQLDAEALQPWIDQVLQSRVTDSGDLEVKLPDGTTASVSQVRLRQYGSIAYSLRVVLSVQQDALIEGGQQLLPLAPSAVDVLKEMLDVLALAVQSIADAEARRSDEVEIGETRFTTSWNRVVPPRSAETEAPKTEYLETSAVAVSPQGGSKILMNLVAEKLAAYEAYNDIPSAERWKLIVRNIERFYARYPVAQNQAGMEQLLEAYFQSVDRYVRGLLERSQGKALEAGHSIIRSHDVELAVGELLPSRIDKFEDALLFPRLPAADRLTLESYDCDSYRDFGLHWWHLGRAYSGSGPQPMTLDPFAAELFTESVSEYGVAVLQLAGLNARAQRIAPYLRPEDLERGEQQLAELAGRHRAAPQVKLETAPISSAVASQTAEVATGAPYFVDHTTASVITFEHRSSRWLSELRRSRLSGPPTFSGGGVAAEDVDGDGFVDLLFVGGAGNALLLNDGNGGFRDVTAAAGLDFRRSDGSTGEARQPLIADLDNDGLQDILITYVGDNHRLYRNLGGADFEDLTDVAGLGGADLVGGPAAVCDFDGDGLLDVYVGYFGDFPAGSLPNQARDNKNGLPNQLFRNLGGMRFTNVTEGSGAADTGWAQALSHTDFDRDGRQDLIVANDYGRNAFLRNVGEVGGAIRFEDVSDELGMNKAFHSMNVGISDLNADGFPEVYVSNIATMVKDNKYVLPDVGKPLDFSYETMATMLVQESNVLYMSHAPEGQLAGYQPSADVERGETSTGWAWDGEFFDFDHDGDDDLYVVNGSNEYNVLFSQFYEDTGSGQPQYHHLSYDRESNVFYVNDGGKLRNQSSASGADFLGNSRSTAYLDLEGDGDLDIAVNNFHAPATMLRNDSAKRGRWLALRLEGDPARGSNRDAIGARVVANTDNLSLLREVQGGSGYLSQNPKQLHFGTGQADVVDLTITWPNGEVQVLTGVAPGYVYRLQQGSSTLERVP